MVKKLLSFLGIIWLTGAINAVGDPFPASVEQETIPVTRWACPLTEPITFEEWQRAQLPPVPFLIEKTYASPRPSEIGYHRKLELPLPPTLGVFAVIVNSTLKPHIQTPWLNRYVLHLAGCLKSPCVLTG